MVRRILSTWSPASAAPRTSANEGTECCTPGGGPLRWLVDFTSRVDCGEHSVVAEDDALAVATFSTLEDRD